ncbi:uncharacterized protein LACBIDRAFT_323297 [Laccaria bicolor S238N-H82]|uniref:Predicted protein n=1 Tax=Laccaria bicolor (strain S238N-H82 / ATCC MYA-4686) TaxID=486041 RepID=B0CZR9_LACBS|nr:uncharacterized protein LACBIDRAFT_323297 [Laccaria bicolor S238N-H82]EDR12200.1 predicted protein [Laccaria bicolor S238N-H82]|eukprot:XP_001876464.1 predicted protein [Laccaria bicolor S238N-H82]
MDETHPPATTNIDLPHEIQRLIFEMAARSHRGAGFNLIQVAHFVYTWIEPILYERIEILGSSVAPSLLRAIRMKDPAFLHSTVRALAISGDVDLKYVKPIFAASRGIVSFSPWGIAVNPLIYLPFIRSPYLRRLALISGPPHDSAFNIPTEMLTKLTHVVVVSNFSWTSWIDLDRALNLKSTASSAPVASLTATPTTLASFAAFQNLTHFAVAQRYWPHISNIREVAQKLRYFVILSQSDALVHRDIIMRAVLSLNDRRLVVVNMKHFWDWPQGDSRFVTTFWDKVETLVSGGFISDQGDRWPTRYERA